MHIIVILIVVKNPLKQTSINKEAMEKGKRGKQDYFTSLPLLLLIFASMLIIVEHLAWFLSLLERAELLA